MGRKKKQVSEGEDSSEKKDHKPSIHGDAKRSIVAVFLFALAVVFFLGFVNAAGTLGNFINKAAGLLFGWGKWVSPLVLIIGGVILLYRKETVFYVTKIAGILIAFLGILGFLHVFFELDKILEVAKAGAGGGYVGYIVSFLLLKTTGIYAGVVILSAILIIGLITAFNFSIVGFVGRLLNLWKKEEAGSDNIDEVDDAEPQENEPEKKEAEPEPAPISEEERVWVEETKSVMPKFSVRPVKSSPDEDIESKVVSKKAKKEWRFPPLDLLESSTEKAQGGDIGKKAKIIHDTLQHFGVDVELGEIQVGPTVTQYSFRPASGVKLSKITGLSNDLALALAAHPIRIEAPIPGKSLVGIEVPNKQVAKVRLRNLLESESFSNKKSNLTLALGEDVSGSYILSDLKKMPHLMIAGSTGTGKSVCINTILLSLLYQNSPSDLRMIMIDPKRVELSLYNGIPHLLSDAIVENGNAIKAFRWAIGEMERRYRIFQDTGSRDLESYNQKVREGQKRRYSDKETGEFIEEEIDHLPNIVIVIDELADLMASHGKEVEGAIIRLAQMARAVGIHLIVSTQRPSVEVLTGLIKANITTRIAFKVATQIDSRTILDAGGAEKLLGNGDMLLLSSQSAKLKRIQGVLVSEAEVNRVVNFIRSQEVETKKENLEGDADLFAGSGKVDFEAAAAANPQFDDDLYEEAKKVVIQSGKASTSFLQRRLRIGYARAARLIDMLEEQGVVGPGEGAKPREILVSRPSMPEGAFASQIESKPDLSVQDDDAVSEDEKNLQAEEDALENHEEIAKEESGLQEARDKWQI